MSDTYYAWGHLPDYDGQSPFRQTPSVPLGVVNTYSLWVSGLCAFLQTVPSLSVDDAARIFSIEKSLVGQALKDLADNGWIATEQDFAESATRKQARSGKRQATRTHEVSVSETLKSTKNQNVCYRYFDSDGDLLYVGVSNNFGSRHTQHRSSSWWTQAVTVEGEAYRSRAEALASELIWIQKSNPVHNISKTAHRSDPVLLAERALSGVAR